MALSRVRGHLRLVVGGTAAGAAAVVLLTVMLGPIADRATPHDKDRAAAVNATRQILLATAAGAAALVGLAFTGRTYYLSRRGQFTERYTRAIMQLASEKLTERLGGVYALEHLMRESSREHETVVEVLAAFVRESAPIRHGTDTELEASSPLRPTTDVQAALTVLARRPVRLEPHRLDLADTDLRGANLRWADLRRARLSGAWLQGARLSGAQLQGARLGGAQLQGARLDWARLYGANLDGAQLQGADLDGAQLDQGVGVVGGDTIQQTPPVKTDQDRAAARPSVGDQR
jgi:Pentapeptide repeats (8 copies)